MIARSARLITIISLLLFAAVAGHAAIPMFPPANTVWVSAGGNLRAAKNAVTCNATTRTCIMVGPGRYYTNDLWKACLDWFYWPGATVSFTSDGNGDDAGIYDDRTSATPGTNTVAGYGSFEWHGGPEVNADYVSGAFVVSNSLSVVTLSGNSILCEEGGALQGARQGALLGLAGRMIANFGRIFDPNNAISYTAGVYWEGGEMDVTCPVIDMDNGYGVWAKEIATNTSANLWVKGYQIQCRSGVGLQIDTQAVSTNNAFRVWVDANELAGATGVVIVNGHTNFNRGTRSYVRCDKLDGTVSVNSGTLWINALGKWAARAGQFLNMNGGRLFATSPQYEDLQGSSVGVRRFDIQNGVSFFNGGWVRTADGMGFWIRGGTNRLVNMLVDTSAGSQSTNIPLTLQANGTILQNCTMIAPAGSTNFVHAALAQNLKIYGTVQSNKNTNNLVSILSGTLQVDADVTE